MILLYCDPIENGVVTVGPSLLEGGPATHPSQQYTIEEHFVLVDHADRDLEYSETVTLLQKQGFRLATAFEQNHFYSLIRKRSQLQEEG